MSRIRPDAPWGLWGTSRILPLGLSTPSAAVAGGADLTWWSLLWRGAAEPSTIVPTG